MGKRPEGLQWAGGDGSPLGGANQTPTGQHWNQGSNFRVLTRGKSSGVEENQFSRAVPGGLAAGSPRTSDQPVPLEVGRSTRPVCPGRWHRKSQARGNSSIPGKPRLSVILISRLSVGVHLHLALFTIRIRQATPTS